MEKLIDQKTFEARAARLRLHGPTREALAAVVVGGKKVADAAEQFGVTRQAIYRARAALDSMTGKVAVLTVRCPRERADRLRQLIDWQLAKWRAEDAAAEAAKLAPVADPKPADPQSSGE